MQRWEAALCDSDVLGSDSPPPAPCVGDTNICGARAGRATLLLYASEWSRAKPGRKKTTPKKNPPTPRRNFVPGRFFKQWEDLNRGLGLAPGNANPLPVSFLQLSCLLLIAPPPHPAALACSQELCGGHSSGFVLCHGTAGQRGVEMGGPGWRDGVPGLGICPTGLGLK